MKKIRNLSACLLTLFAALFVMTLFGIAFGQTLEDPASWIESPQTIVLAASLLTGYIVQFLTAFFKDAFDTHGKNTMVLSFFIAAGMALFVGLGIVGTEGGGLQNAVRWVFMTTVAFLQSNGLAKAQRQAIRSRRVLK